MKNSILKLFLILSLLALPTSLLAQHQEDTSETHGNGAPPLKTARPGSAEPAYVIPVGALQFEGGFAYEKAGHHKVKEFGDLLVRYGLFKKFELGLGLNSYSITDDGHHEYKGFQDISLSARVEIYHGSSHFEIFKPQLALLAGSSLPSGSDHFTDEKAQPMVRLTGEWHLNEKLVFGTTLGNKFVRDDHENFNEFLAVFGLHAHLSHELGAFAEFVRHDSGGDHPHESNLLEGGFTFLLNDNFQLDVFGEFEVGADGDDTPWMIGTGLVYRLFANKH